MADKQCTCLASKLMWEHYPPTPPFHCGENEIQASLISSASVGATPTPATNILWEVIQPAVCKPAVAKQCWKMTTGALPALPTISGSVAQSEEQPVVCGKAEGASPFGSAIFSERSSVFRAPGLGPGGRRWKSCRSDQPLLIELRLGEPISNCCRGRTHEASVF